MNWGRERRVGRIALAGVTAVAALCGAAWPAAGSNRVVIENPGRFVVTHGAGSYTAFLDAEGNESPIGYMDIGTPPCDNEVDDDADGLADSADPQCLNSDDANERLAGMQEYIPTTLPIKIKANGVITARPSDFVMHPREKCTQASGGVWCLAITIRGAGPSQRGHMTRDGDISLTVPVTVKFDVISGYPGFDPRCKVGYISHTFVSDDYDEETGTAHFDGGDQPAPALTNCGDWTDFLNDVLALPGTSRAVMESTTLNAEGDPPRMAD